MRRIILPAVAVAASVFRLVRDLPGEYLKHLLQTLSRRICRTAFSSDTAASPWLRRPSRCCTPAAGMAIHLMLMAWLVWRLASRATSGPAVAIVAGLPRCRWPVFVGGQRCDGIVVLLLAREPGSGARGLTLPRDPAGGSAKAAWLESPLIAFNWALVAGCTVYPLPEAHVRHAHDPADLAHP
jgi:hypothetical protein